ncbi:MAG: cysteine--tRNA ligase [Acidiphilium sp.]
MIEDMMVPPELYLPTELYLHDTKTRARRAFVPRDPAHVTLYVCGPTVYDLAHIGNARSVVVFDVLVRLLRVLYPRVTYARNITDIDDKINARARAEGVAIGDVTARTTAWFHRDMAALYVRPPDIEPRATETIPEIIAMIERLIGLGHAYAAAGHVLFAVATDPNYGKFSGRSPDELLAGARIDVAAYKRDPGDFVLWKPSDPELPGWDSPWGRGRPGWHIECSAMIHKHLGETIDIHGGGSDLLFPHHENEMAQSCCAFPGAEFARYWLHNGMLQVNGEKMSKSLGNFRTVADVLAQAPAEAVRLLLLKTHYRSLLDFTDAGLQEAKRELDRFYRALRAHPGVEDGAPLPDRVLACLADDLNVPGAIAALHQLADAALAGDRAAARGMKAAGAVLGIFNHQPEAWFVGEIDQGRVDALIAQRAAARQARNFAEADRLRQEIEAMGLILEDGPGGSYSLRKA